eukprot:gene10953-14708_t
MSKSVGDYVLSSRIGKGSFAYVYRGTHHTYGGEFAIKAISKENLYDRKLISGLESEIKIMQEFKHENIVHLFEFFSSEKNFYLVLELCKGGDLNQFIKKQTFLTERVAYSFLCQLTNGLSFLADHNFIHRDLKPANVLLSESSENAILKLADFGFARTLTAASLAQTRCGTPLYMAPEVLESRDYDAKADIWSVGCIFFEMLTGNCPFKGNNEGDLLMNIKTKELSIPNHIIVNKLSVDILAKLLERNPNRRASIDQLMVITGKLSTMVENNIESTAGAVGITSSSSPEDNRKRAGSLDRGSHLSSQQFSQENSNQLPFSDVNTTTNPSVITSPPSARVAVNPSTATATTMFLQSGPGGGNGSLSNSYSQPRYAPQQSQQLSNVESENSPNSRRRHSADSANTPIRNNNPNSYSTSPVVTTAATIGYSLTKAFTNYFTATPSSNAPPSGYTQRTNSRDSNNNIKSNSNNIKNAYISTQDDVRSSRGNSLDGVYQQQSPSSVGIMYRNDINSSSNNQNYSGKSDSINSNNSKITNGNLKNINSSFQKTNDNYTSSQRDDEINNNSSNFLHRSGSGLSLDGDFVLVGEVQELIADNKSNIPFSQRSQHQTSNNVSPAGSGKYKNNTNDSPLNSFKNNLSQSQPNVLLRHEIKNQYNSNGNAVIMNNNNNTQSSSSIDNGSFNYLNEFIRRCDHYCKVVSIIIVLADSFIQDVIGGNKKSGFFSTSSTMDIIVNDNRSGKIKIGSYNSIESQNEDEEVLSISEQLENSLESCSLYFHSLSLLQFVMTSIERDLCTKILYFDNQNLVKNAVDRLKKDVLILFDQIVHRAEMCQKLINSLTVTISNGNNNNLVNNMNSMVNKNSYSIPAPEPVLFKAAVKKENDADLEELTGNHT